MAQLQRRWRAQFACITARSQDGEGLNLHGYSAVDEKEEAEAPFCLIHFPSMCGTLHGALCCDGECNTVPVLSGLRINWLGESRERRPMEPPAKIVLSMDERLVGSHSENFIYTNWNNNKMPKYKQKTNSPKISLHVYHGRY